MKKFLSGLAAFTLLLATTGCEKELVEKSDTANPIMFQAFLGKPTKSRAVETDIDTLKTYATSANAGIAVQAYSSTGLYADWSLYYASSAWTYGTPVFQPGFALSYYAWYPKSALSLAEGAGISGATTTSYTVGTTAANQIDLLATAFPNSLASEIELQFHHLLSQINFAVQHVKDVKIKIKSITLANIGSTATFTIGQNLAWSEPTATTGYTYITGITTAQTNGHADSTGSVSLMPEAGGLMLMPQEFGSSSTAAFTITYDLADMAGNALVSDGSATALLKDFATAKWEFGKRYLYLIDFSNYFTNYISFTVDVSPWADATPVVLPIEVTQATGSTISNAIKTLLTTYAGQTAFQINVRTAPAANIELTIPADQTPQKTTTITITFAAGLNSKSVTLHADAVTAGWAISTSGSVVTLTYTVPEEP